MLNIFFSDIKTKQELYISDGAKCSFIKALLSDGTCAILIYRLMQWCKKHHLTPIAYFLQYINKVINSCVIGIGAEFDKGLVFAHPVGVIINSKVRGGKGIIIESGVVIGDEKGKSPVLGDNIFIGSGAKIIGEIILGSNIKIGANAVVIKSCDDNQTLIGIPAKPLIKK